VKPIVVLTSCLPEPARSSANGASAGISIERRARVERLGSEPSSALRRSIMYWYSIESSLGRKYGGSSASIVPLGDLVVQVQPVAQRRPAGPWSSS
jgi:hypothetical protein